MEHIRKIELYLKGEMSEEERIDFVNLMSDDEKLRKEVDLIKEINEAIVEQDVQKYRQTVREVIEANLETVPKWVSLGRIFLKLPVAAAILLLIGFSMWQIFMTKSGPDYFNEMYSPYQADITTRSIVGYE